LPPAADRGTLPLMEWRSAYARIAASRCGAGAARTLAAVAAAVLLAAPVGAAGGGVPGLGDVYSSRTLAAVPHAWSWLLRLEPGLYTVNHLAGLPPDRQVTLRVLVFNHPEACAGNGIPGLSACGAADMVPGGPAGFAEVTGPTGVSTPSGHLTLPAWISDPSITNPLGAVVVLSFSIEGCGTGLPCADDLAVHNPPG
jgi:hypothetical protein